MNPDHVEIERLKKREALLVRALELAVYLIDEDPSDSPVYEELQFALAKAGIKSSIQ